MIRPRFHFAGQSGPRLRLVLKWRFRIFGSRILQFFRCYRFLGWLCKGAWNGSRGEPRANPLSIRRRLIVFSSFIMMLRLAPVFGCFCFVAYTAFVSKALGESRRIRRRFLRLLVCRCQSCQFTRSQLAMVGLPLRSRVMPSRSRRFSSNFRIYYAFS